VVQLRRYAQEFGATRRIRHALAEFDEQPAGVV
jgi:hypothetical protein